MYTIPKSLMNDGEEPPIFGDYDEARREIGRRYSNCECCGPIHFPVDMTIETETEQGLEIAYSYGMATLHQHPSDREKAYGMPMLSFELDHADLLRLEKLIVELRNLGLLQDIRRH
jgi:hypothetical protein